MTRWMIAGWLMLVLAGCFPTPTELLTRAPSTWSDRDGLTIAANLARTNAADQRENFIVTALPLTPDVVFSFRAMNLYRRGWDSVEANLHANALLKEFCGLFQDEDGALWTPTKGRYTGVHDLDSLMFVVILRNRTYPCQAPHFNGVPLMRQADVPCDQEDISDIEHRIALVNETGDTLYAAFVAGRKHDILIYQEYLFVRFRFRDFTATPEIRLIVKRREGDVALTITLR